MSAANSSDSKMRFPVNIAVMAMLDSKEGTLHTSIDVLKIGSQSELDALIARVYEATADIETIDMSTARASIPKWAIERAWKATQGQKTKSFIHMNENLTLTLRLSNQQVFLVSSQEIAKIRARLEKHFDSIRLETVKRGSYIPHATVRNWSEVKSLPAGHVFRSKRIVLRAAGICDVCTIMLGE